MTGPAAAPKPCAHSEVCRCDVGAELARAIEAAGDSVTLSGRVGRAADLVSSKSGRIRVKKITK